VSYVLNIDAVRTDSPMEGAAHQASQSQETGMKNSPYLDRPLFPLAVALPRMLENVAVELTTAGPVEARRLRQRAQLILDLLTPRQPPIPL